MHPTRSLLATAVIGLLMAVNGFVLGPLWLFGGGATFSETAASWPFALSQQLSWLLLTAALVAVPEVLRGGTRREAPGWARPLLTVALSAQAATAFVMGFVAPWLAEVEPRLLDIGGGSFQLAMTLVWIGFVLAMAVVGVVLARTGGLGLVAPALVVVGALAVPGAGPVGVGLLGLGLALAGRARLRHAAPTSAATTSPRPAPVA